MSNKLIFALVLFSTHCLAEKINFCNQPYLKEIDQFKENEINKFSNQKGIASKADHTLEILIISKSPIIMSWIKSRNFDPQKDTDQIALEWRKYFALNFIINKYPIGDKYIDKEIETLFKIFSKHYFPSGIKKRLEEQLLKTKHLAISKLRTYDLNKNAMSEIEKNISSVKLYFPKTLSGSKYQNRLLEFFEWGMAYDPVSNEINIGINGLNFNNDESLKSVLAHELAHSFDSCRWSAYYKGAWPFEKIGKCLREFAKTRDDSKIDEFIKNKRISAELATSLKENPTCNKNTYPPVGLQADQLPETFADWFSAEVTSTLAGKDFRIDLCEEKELREGSSYLSNHDRLYKIFLAHPDLKKRTINSNTEVKYCSF